MLTPPMRTETTTKPLRELVRGFNTGKIQLPQFQRDYVWKPNKIRNLLDSLLKAFPIGGFYLWRPTSATLDPRPKAFGQTRIIGVEFVGYLIDGQQRLTSLEAAFGLYSGEDKGGAELACFLDLEVSDAERGRDTRVFVSYGGRHSVARRVDAADSTLVPVSRFLEGADHSLRRETEDSLRQKGWDARRIKAALVRFDRACHMLDQQVPCTTVYDVSDKEAVEVFSRLNKGGTQLRQGDVRAAELARGSAVGVLRKMREFVSGDRPQRLGFGFSFAFRAFVVFHRQSAQFASLKPDWMESPGPHSRNLAQSWHAAENALAEALRFVDEDMGWSRRSLLPSANALIVLAAAMDRAEFKSGEGEKELYRRWLCLTALRGVFRGSVESTINRFLKAVRESRRPAKALVEALHREEGKRIQPDELKRCANLWGPATQVIHTWLVNSGARDWLSEISIDGLARADLASSPGGDLTVHHIFPREVLSDILEDADDANRPANYALISRSTNAEFGAKGPDDVLKTLTPAQRKIAEIQFFGEDAGDRLGHDRYEEFCDWRAQRLAQALNEFLGMERRGRE
jgi:hypothetical protein